MSIEFRELSKQVYGEAHISHTDLSLNPGVFNVLLGPTLSGKTSLMRLMAGLAGAHGVGMRDRFARRPRLVFRILLCRRRGRRGGISAA